MEYVGGVLYIDSCSATMVQSNADGQIGKALPSKSSRTMTTVRPAGPIFFCAPPKMTPYCDTSITRDRICDDMSATMVVPAGTCGACWYSTPSMVSLVQICR